MQLVLRKIHHLLLVCLVGSMPFNIKGVNLTGFVIISLVFVFILSLLFSRDGVSKNVSGMGVLLFISFYFIHLLGLFKTDNYSEAFFELQKKLSILIFPVVLYYSPRLSYREIKTVVLTFVISSTLVCLFCFCTAAYHFFINGDASYFFYQDFSGIVGMHAAYLSMYLSFSVVILLYVYYGEIKDLSPANKFIFYSVIGSLLLSIFLLAGRTQIILLIIGAVVYFTFLLFEKYGFIKSIFGGILIGATILATAFLFPVNRERFKEAINYNNQYSLDKKWGEQQMKYLIWTGAWGLIKSQPITGVGIGDTQDELQRYYLDHRYTSLTYWANTRFNAHNQFLETTITLGVGGGLLFLCSIFFSIRYGWKEKRFLYLTFVILFSFSCLTESLLERQNGIVFYAFFNSFLFFNSFSKTVDYGKHEG